MLAAAQLAKAELRQLDASFATEIANNTWTKVQFNPDTLKVSFANQLVTPSGPGDQRGSPARQFVGAGTTKLAVTLVFDVTAALAEGQEPVDDVRKLTQKVAFFITPQKNGDQPPQYIPPAVRFLWGSFQFDGLMETMEESLELFSSDGKPQRAIVGLGMSQQKIQEFAFRDTGTGPGLGLPGGGAPGTRPLAQAVAGVTLQGMVAGQGAASWQNVAAANGIENPRQLQPGQLINLNVNANVNL